MPVIIYMPKTNEFKKKFVLTYNLEYDTLHEVLESRIIIELFADEVRAALNREAGERPALSRSCDAESSPTRHWETGKAGEDEDAEPEELPRWNAVSSLRETGRRDDIFILYAFLQASKKAFCFVATVTIRRFSPDLPMALLETKCGCTHSDIVSINV